MLIVAGVAKIRPEMRSEAVSIIGPLVKATQAEAGCISYNFYSDLADPNTLHVFEEWESEEALNAHLQTGHVQEFFAALPGLIAAPPAVTRYSVEQAEPL